MSRTASHAPFWVQQNRKAAAHPYGAWDHRHEKFGTPIYKWTRIVPADGEELEERVTSYQYIEVTKTLTHYDGTTTEYVAKELRAVWTTKPKPKFERFIIGYRDNTCTEGELYTGNWTRTWEQPCTIGWFLNSFYSSMHWGRSLKHEKDTYWGGDRARKRTDTRRMVNAWNSGDDLEGEDNFSRGIRPEYWY